MTDPCMARVLIVENDLKTRNQLAEILTRPGYIALAAEGQGPDLIGEAKRLSALFHPHVVIMDLRLLDDEYSDDRSGLELLKDRSFASSRCILHSAYLKDDYRVAVEALVDAGVVDVVGKQEHPLRIIKAVEKAARNKCICQRKFSIEWPAGWNEEEVVKTILEESAEIPADMVTDIIGHLFPSASAVTLKTLRGMDQSSTSVFRGRSVLLQATIDNKEPFVIKFAPRAKTEKEVNAYRENIEDRLHGHYYAQLLDHKLFWDLGGICYRLIGSEQEKIKLFTVFYQEQETSAEVTKPLHHFFEQVWQHHYLDSRAPLSVSFFDAYDSSLKLSKRLGKVEDHQVLITLDGLPGRYLNPLRWILEHQMESFFPRAMQAITHGDLHGDNLFVDDEHAWAIDFERSRSGPVLRDFAELEADIVTRLMRFPEGDQRSAWDVAVLLCRPGMPAVRILPVEKQDPEIIKCLEVVQDLRAMALQMTGFADMREYYWCLLFDTAFSVLSAEKRTEKSRRALLYASVLCERLTRWESPWPPVERMADNSEQSDRLEV